MSYSIDGEDTKVSTQVEFEGSSGQLRVSQKRLSFAGDGGNAMVDVPLGDVCGVEMRREPIDWGAVFTGCALLLGAVAAFFAGEVVSELSALTTLVGLVSGGGGVVVVAWAVNRSRVLTVRTAGAAYDFGDAGRGTAKKVANAVQLFG